MLLFMITFLPYCICIFISALEEPSPHSPHGQEIAQNTFLTVLQILGLVLLSNALCFEVVVVRPTAVVFPL